jgi:hypothetical protein
LIEPLPMKSEWQTLTLHTRRALVSPAYSCWHISAARPRSRAYVR